MVFNQWGRKGEESPTSKLTETQVYEIRRRWDAGERKFHEQYGVSLATIDNNIGSRRSWLHLPEEEDLHIGMWRPRRGTQVHKRSHLSEDDIREIRKRWDAGERGFEKEFRVAKRTLYDIGRRKTWKHVEEEQ